MQNCRKPWWRERFLSQVLRNFAFFPYQCKENWLRSVLQTLEKVMLPVKIRKIFDFHLKLSNFQRFFQKPSIFLAQKFEKDVHFSQNFRPPIFRSMSTYFEIVYSSINESTSIIKEIITFQYNPILSHWNLICNITSTWTICFSWIQNSTCHQVISFFFVDASVVLFLRVLRYFFLSFQLSFFLRWKSLLKVREKERIIEGYNSMQIGSHD